jgi:hypothetical protein
MHFQALALISMKSSGLQKGTFWCPFCTLFRVRMILSWSKITLLPLVMVSLRVT